jgi:hypothetical protein
MSLSGADVPMDQQSKRREFLRSLDEGYDESYFDEFLDGTTKTV